LSCSPHFWPDNLVNINDSYSSHEGLRKPRFCCFLEKKETQPVNGKVSKFGANAVHADTDLRVFCQVWLKLVMVK